MTRNTSWAFAGNSVYAGCQWLVFVLLVKSLAVADVGGFAYATAVTGPIFVLANVRLRNLLATGTKSPADFSDYLTARLLTTAAAVVVSLVIGALVGGRAGSFAVVALMTAGRACEAISDICHGLFQRELDMRSPAIGLILNGVLSVALVLAALAVAPSIAAATGAYATGSFLALIAWDLPRKARLLATLGSRRRGPRPVAAGLRLLATASPLGLSSAIGSVQTNLPRYVIASYLGPAALAVFAAVSYVTMLGHLVVNATSQAALPVLARDANTSRRRYTARLLALVAGSVALGACALLATALLGRTVLAALYGAEYAAHVRVLLWLVAAAVVAFTSVFLGTGTTARQRFGAQFGVTAASFAVVASLIVPFVKRYGLYGAAWALLAGALVELCAYAGLTLWDLQAKTSFPEMAPRAARRGTRRATGRPQPIRVLHVLGRLERGGAELRTVELAESFPPHRVRSDFVVLSGLDGILDGRVRAAGGRVIKCRLDAAFPASFRRLLRDEGYDAVHSHVHFFSGVILAMAWSAGVRSRIAHLHTARVNDRRDTLRRRVQIAVCRKLIAWTATDIVGVGQGTMDSAWGPQWSADPRCRVIYAGVKPERVRRASRVQRQPQTIVNVASIQALKNQMRLVHIMRRLMTRVPDVQLHLIGKEIGDYGDKIRRAAADAGVAERVHFVGEVDEPMAWLGGADLMIMPSLWEGLPCAALEACALGRPVLASDLPGTRELARYFPHLHVLSLEEDDEVWASAAASLIQQDAATVNAAECLAKSPFAFRQTRQAHYDIWSRSRAYA